MVEIFKRSIPQLLPRFHEFPEIKPSEPMSFLKWLSSVHDTVHSYAVDTVSSAPRWLVYTGLTLGAGTLATASYFYTKPQKLILLRRSVGVWKAGFTVRSVKGKTYNYTYIERGTASKGKPSMVFLQGFDGSKEDWVDMIVKILPRDLHIICVDLPGQGSTVATDMSDASLYKLADCLNEFVTLSKLDAKPFHLLGISMGGAVSGLFAAKHGKKLDRLTLMCPTINCPIQTELQEMLQTGQMVYDSNDDPARHRKFVLQCVYNKTLMPTALWVYSAINEMKKPNRTFNRTLVENLVKELDEDNYQAQYTQINIPVQVMWGEEDEILHVSGASLLEDLIPTLKRLDILPQCGHVFPLEQREVTKSLVMDFYNTTYSE